MMTIKPAFRILIAASSAIAAPCFAASTDAPANIADGIVAIHNHERALVGSPPMVWDEALAVSAASYGPALIALGHLQHSPRDTRPGQRENLAMGSTNTYNYAALAGFWISEKANFTPGLFPNVSRTGNWLDVSHYTQMIWRGTTRVGCSLQRGGDQSYLICRYAPPGNVDGQPVP